MNHLGDTNKMVSDTPISDSTPHNVADLGILCRRLERQLNAANVELEEKRKDIVWLATEKAKLEDRIKRLEEALSRIANQDYRGNRSTESQIAFEALKEVE